MNGRPSYSLQVYFIAITKEMCMDRHHKRTEILAFDFTFLHDKPLDLSFEENLHYIMYVQCITS